MLTTEKPGESVTSSRQGASKPGEPWGCALGIVRRAVERKLHLFAHFPDLEFDDLVQEGLLAARRAHLTFDPQKAKYSTWVYRFVSFRMIDLWRRRSRVARDEAKAAVVESAEACNDLELPEDISLDDEALADWMGRVYRSAIHALRSRRRGRQHDRPERLAQAVARAGLMHRLRLSTRGAAALVADQEDLRKAMRLERPPSHMWFKRAWEIARRLKLHLLRTGSDGESGDE